jgi:hypothetical protein
LAKRLLDWLLWHEANVSLPDIYQRSLNAISDQATARRLGWHPRRLLAGADEDYWLVRIEKGAEINRQVAPRRLAHRARGVT